MVRATKVKSCWATRCMLRGLIRRMLVGNGGIGLWIGWYPSDMVAKVRLYTRIQGAPSKSVTTECKTIGHPRSTHAWGGLSKFNEVLHNYGLWSHVWKSQWFFNFFQNVHVGSRVLYTDYGAPDLVPTTFVQQQNWPQNFFFFFFTIGPVRQSEIKYFVLVYFPFLDRCYSHPPTNDTLKSRN